VANANVDTDTIEGTALIHTAAATHNATNTKLDSSKDGEILRRLKEYSFGADINARTKVY